MPPSKQRKGSNKRAERDVLPASRAPKTKPAQAQIAEDPSAKETKFTFTPEQLAAQQKILGLFQTAFSDVLSSLGFATTLQQVKAALYEREFERAFGREEFLDVYAARWSPTRALGYAAVLDGLREWLDDVLVDDGEIWEKEGATVGAGDAVAEAVGNLSLETPGASGAEEPDKNEPSGDDVRKDNDGAVTVPDPQKSTPAPTKPKKTLRVVALGGGTAELAAFVSHFADAPETKCDLTLVDTGPWAGAVSKLHAALLTPPPIFKYASAAAKAANTPLTDRSRLRPTFLQRDVLALSAADLAGLLGSTPLLVTLMFTLNELYTGGGIGRTTSFLRGLGRAIAPGSLLLVVDSPGSYSEAAVGKEGGEKKKYPMSWLVDHTLLRAGKSSDRQRQGQQQDGAGAGGEESRETAAAGTAAAAEEGCSWKKIEENDSIWFRVADELRYPIPLENMRYQIHLYRAVAATGDSS